MPTFAEIRRHVRHKLASTAGQEDFRLLLRGHCALLATLALDPSGVMTRTTSTDPRFVAHCDHIMAYLVRDFAEELELLGAAYASVEEEARARGLEGGALQAWCFARLKTEFIGAPLHRRAKPATLPRGCRAGGSRPGPCRRNLP
jgi:hypothetical protein